MADDKLQEMADMIFVWLRKHDSNPPGRYKDPLGTGIFSVAYSFRDVMSNGNDRHLEV